MKYSLFIIVFFCISCGESPQTSHIVSDTTSPMRYQYDSSHGKEIEKKIVPPAFIVSQLQITSDENFTDYISFLMTIGITEPSNTYMTK